MADSFEELLSEVALPRRSVRVCVRGDLAERIESLTAKLADASLADTGSLAGGADVAAIAEELTAAEADAEAHMRTIVVQAVPALAWRRLMAQHPPTDAQAERGGDVNVETFLPAAVALCSVEPKMTEQQALTLAGANWNPDDPESPQGLTEGQWERLTAAVVELNRSGGDLPKSGLATVVRRLFEPRSTTAASEESHTPSS